MPISLQGIREKTGEAWLFGKPKSKDALHVHYYLIPDVTLEDEQEEALVSKEGSEDDKLDYQAGKFIKVVARMDLEDEGQPVPLTVEAVRKQIPYPLILEILAAIDKDRRAHPNY